MKAIEFSNLYSRTVNDFFQKCLKAEDMKINKINEVTVCFSDYGFKLRLETTDNDFSQEFEVNEKEIIPLYFETH